MTEQEKGNDINAKQWFVKSDYQYKLAEFDEGGFLGIDEDVVAEMLEDYYNFKLNQKFNKDDRTRIK